jgi:hypothetical protein
MQSIYSHLVYEQHKGMRQLDSLKFIWIQRDPVFVKDSELVRDVPIKKQTNTDDVTDSDERVLGIGAAFLAAIPQDYVTDDDLTKYYDSLIVDTDEVYDSVISNANDIENRKKKKQTNTESVGDREDDNDERMLGIGAAYLATIPQDYVTDNDLPKYNDSLIVDTDEVYDRANANDIDNRKKKKKKQTDTNSVGDSDDDNDERMLGIGVAYLSTIPQDYITDDDLTKYDDSLKVDTDEIYDSFFSNTRDIESQKKKKEDNTKLEKNDSVFDLQIYVTDTKSGIVASHIPNVQYGRPDIYKLFRKMKEDILNRGGEHERVAVCVCAPSPVAEVCRTACIIYSNDRIRFDIHLESMCV